MASPSDRSHPFTLDPRLEADSLKVLDLSLCELRLMNDQRYPWLLLIPRRVAMREIIDLAAEDRHQLYAEIEIASERLLTVSGADKLNIGALGNLVAQLHVHVIARFVGDTTWPGPVWGVGEPEPYAQSELSVRLQRLRDAFAVPT